METQKKKLFQLTKETEKKIRYIRLIKKASYLEKELKNIKYNQIGENDKCDTIQFYAFGFYDLLICIKPQISTSRAYKEHFLISYPFEKKANTLKVEQWFGILPLSEEKRYYAGVRPQNEDDPFFCENKLQAELPFLGVILISLGNRIGNQRGNDFEAALEDYAKNIENVFGGACQKNNKYIAEIYYSLNCADLCLVIRTDALPFIHQINYSLNMKAFENDFSINTTVIFSVQDNTNLSILKKSAEKNRSVSFIVRSNEKYNENSRGVNGIGRYVTQFQYEEYINFLPQLFAYKLNQEESSNKFIYSICHEREWFKEDYKEHHFVPKEDEKKLQEAICIWIKEIHGLIIEIEKGANEFFSYSRCIYEYKELFTQEFGLIKELVYSYSDLWYQEASENGFIFFTQLLIVLYGIKNMLQEIEKININDEMLRPSIDNLLKVMHWSACDLNGYNKQFLFFNQDSVNYPSYEIQSKVNAEKYMAAYCSFLYKFFVLYYQEKRDDQNIVQYVPLALVDLNQRKIITNLFFSAMYMKNTKDNNKEVRALFAVHFPSSEYFSNIWNSIPLLMHEISHTQNYGKTVDRNSAFVFNVDNFFSEILVTKMLRIVNNGIMIHTSSFLVEKLKEKVYLAIVKYREKFFYEKGGFENWGFQTLLVNCEDFYNSIFDKCDLRKKTTYNQFEKLQNKIKKDIDYIMQVIGFDEMCHVFVNTVRGPAPIYYFVNTLYLEFNPDFYEKNKENYDNSFLKKLKQEVCSQKKNEVEYEILRLSLYRFLKYVQHNDTKIPDDVKQIEENMSDSLSIAFMIILSASMWTIFERCSNKFIDRISEKDYYEKLIPSVFPENVPSFANELTAAYKSYREKASNEGKKITLYDSSLMEKMFNDYYEVYLSINNILHFLVDNQYLMNNTVKNNLDIFIEYVHNECEKYICEEEKNDLFKAVFTKSNREQLVKLGLFEKDNTIMKDVLQRALAESEDMFVENVIKDREQLFIEVYADCGMCCAMGFDPFGYCMFAVSIHNIVNDLNAVNRDLNFLADRICSVTRMYFDDIKETWPDILQKFVFKLCDTEMIKSICGMLRSIYPIKEIDEINNCLIEDEYKIKILWNEKKPEHIFKKISKVILTNWKEDIIGKLIEIIESIYEKKLSNEIRSKDKILVAKTYLFNVHSVIQLFIEEDIFLHISEDRFGGFFQKAKKIMDNSSGIRAVRQDACVQEISCFYNMDCPEDENAKNKFEWYYSTYSNRFITQCNFIFDNYCRYRNAYNNLKMQVNVSDNGKVSPDMNLWFDIIDEYYRKEVM